MHESQLTQSVQNMEKHLKEDTSSTDGGATPSDALQEAKALAMEELKRVNYRNPTHRHNPLFPTDER